MFVIEDLSAKTLDEIVRKYVDKDAIVVTDGSSSHINFKEYFKRHEPYMEKDVDKVVRASLPWAHIAIWMCRDGISAIHDEVDKQFLQLYLNEFCGEIQQKILSGLNRS